MIYQARRKCHKLLFFCCDICHKVSWHLLENIVTLVWASPFGFPPIDRQLKDPQYASACWSLRQYRPTGWVPHRKSMLHVREALLPALACINVTFDDIPRRIHKIPSELGRSDPRESGKSLEQVFRDLLETFFRLFRPFWDFSRLSTRPGAGGPGRFFFWFFRGFCSHGYTFATSVFKNSWDFQHFLSAEGTQFLGIIACLGASCTQFLGITAI